MRFESIFHGVVVFIVTACIASVAGAAAQRTFVASTGNDANPCTLTQPCRGFAAAVAKTSAAGEVIVLDSAGYGPVMIAQSVSIIAPPGVYAGISVSSGDGIVIDGSTGIRVLLRGLTINGIAPGVNRGIAFVNGDKLVVENCTIAGMFYGINATASDSAVSVSNTVLRDNDAGGFATLGSLVATLDGVSVLNNNRFSYTRGVAAYDGSRITVNNSVLANNAVGAYASAFFASSGVYVARSTLTENVVAVDVAANPASSVSIVVDANVIVGNGMVFRFNEAGGAENVFTRDNNSGRYNGTFITPGHTPTSAGPF